MDGKEDDAGRKQALSKISETKLTKPN